MREAHSSAAGGRGIVTAPVPSERAAVALHDAVFEVEPSPTDAGLYELRFFLGEHWGAIPETCSSAHATREQLVAVAARIIERLDLSDVTRLALAKASSVGWGMRLRVTAPKRERKRPVST